MNTHEVYFEVPKSGSLLFDLHAEYIARELVAKFIGLEYNVLDDKIIIKGKLNDFWFDKFNNAVFHLGVLE